VEHDEELVEIVQRFSAKEIAMSTPKSVWSVGQKPISGQDKKMSQRGVCVHSEKIMPELVSHGQRDGEELYLSQTKDEGDP
jgi:hypothetical protein